MARPRSSAVEPCFVLQEVEMFESRLATESALRRQADRTSNIITSQFGLSNTTVDPTWWIAA
jgi:hypothetical protein